MKTSEPGITKIEGKHGAIYRAQIRLKGFKHQSQCFSKLRDAKNWRLKTIEAMKLGRSYETKEMRCTQLSDLIDRYIERVLDSTISNYRTRSGQLVLRQVEKLG